MTFRELKHIFVKRLYLPKDIVLSALTIPQQESFSFVPRVSQAMKVEGTFPHKTTLTSDTN